MGSIGAAEFKARCLELLDQVSPEGLTITKRGRAVARLVPVPKDSATLIGALHGRLRIVGDILTTGQEWDAES